MTNALTIYERMNELQTAASAMHASGFFSDVKSQAQAMVKILAGAEMGLPAFASMTGIHLVQGKPVLGANLIATLVKNDRRYDYRVKQADATACVLTWYENGQAIGESSFTMQEAQAAGLAGKDNWKKYPSDMLFARAISRGARRFAPGIFGGAPVYTPDEMGVDTDEDGQIIDVTPVVTAPPAQLPTGNGTQADPGLPDDEQLVSEAEAKKFIPVAAGLLESDEATVKARLKALGYTAIPGKPAERVTAYRKLRDDLGTTEQSMFDIEAEPVPAGDGAYQES